MANRIHRKGSCGHHSGRRHTAEPPGPGAELCKCMLVDRPMGIPIDMPMDIRMDLPMDMPMDIPMDLILLSKC